MPRNLDFLTFASAKIKKYLSALPVFLGGRGGEGDFLGAKLSPSWGQVGVPSWSQIGPCWR